METTHRTEQSEPARGVSSSNGWVVGSDGSRHSRHAVSWAAANAPGRTGSIDVVRAWASPWPAAWPIASSALTQSLESLEAAARVSLDEVADELREAAGLIVNPHLRVGEETTVLLEAAETADMLILGTRGTGRFERLVLGSTSTRCAIHATVPTVIVPSQPSQRARDIVVALDGSDNALAAFDWACGFADPGSQISAISVWEFTPSLASAESLHFPTAVAHARDEFDRMAAELSTRCGRSDITLTTNFIQGDPRRRIAEHASEADLLAVGARGYGAVGRALLGSVSTWLLHNAEHPIAVVPLPPVPQSSGSPGSTG